METFYVIYFLATLGVSIMASSYGRSAFGYFVLSALITPFIAFFILLGAGKTVEKRFFEQNTK